MVIKCSFKVIFNVLMIKFNTITMLLFVLFQKRVWMRLWFAMNDDN